MEQMELIQKDPTHRFTIGTNGLLRLAWLASVSLFVGAGAAIATVSCHTSALGGFGYAAPPLFVGATIVACVAGACREQGWFWRIAIAVSVLLASSFGGLVLGFIWVIHCPPLSF